MGKLGNTLLESRLNDLHKPFVLLLGSMSPGHASAVAEKLYDMFRQRPGHEPAQLSYSLKPAEYYQSVDKIAERLSAETPLRGHPFRFSENAGVVMMYSCTEKIDEHVSASVTISRNGQDYELVFTFYGNQITKKFVWDTHNGLMAKIKSIIEDEGAKASK